MAAIKLKEGVYSVGVMNPALRTFDIIMTAEYGTTYNAYLVQGEKTALIETVHARFFEEYLENIRQVTDPSNIDYLVVNHTEPDHTGSVAKLLELNPDIKIFCTMAASKYLAQITNRQLNVTVVKAGDTLDLGGRTLRFVPAPFLHWPDSMFTFDERSKTVFTCDFLGAHYCEPRLLDVHCQYPEKYEGAFAYYYEGIFGPFKPFVLDGIKKLEELDFDMVCPSHGLILTRDIEKRIAQYREWSTPKEGGKPVAIVYASAYGYTERMARAAASRLEREGYPVTLVNLVETPLSEAAAAVASCGALLVGTNTINRDATKPVWDLLSSIDAINTKKPAGAFGSYGWSGEAVPMVKARLEQLKFQFVGEGVKAVFLPTEEDLQRMEEYALEAASQMK